MQDMRHRVKQQHGLASVASLHAGVVTVVQRFRSDLGLYVHLHCLATDGAYEEQNDGELRFLAAPPPPPPRMTAVLAQVHEVIRAADDDLDLDPALAACLQLSLAGYLLHPPFAHDAVTALPGGRVRVSFKAPWRSGTAHADMDPLNPSRSAPSTPCGFSAAAARSGKPRHRDSARAGRVTIRLP